MTFFLFNKTKTSFMTQKKMLAIFFKTYFQIMVKTKTYESVVFSLGGLAVFLQERFDVVFSFHVFILHGRHYLAKKLLANFINIIVIISKEHFLGTSFNDF